MRTILVSTDVFAALWAKRQPDEDSENAILERLLGMPKGPAIALQALSFNGRVRGQGRMGAGADGLGGIYNRMFDVRFPAGFEIFRSYKGRHYSAVVRDGRWVMAGQSFPSLFALSMAIIDSRENPWMHWKFHDAKGRVNTISALRKISAEPDKSMPQDEEKPHSRGEKTARKTTKKATSH